MMLRAEQFAREAHALQLRKSGDPAISHQERIVLNLKAHGFSDEETLAIAWLHDVLEDTAVTYDELVEHFGKEIADCVLILTRNVSEHVYKERLTLAPLHVQHIKLFDVLDNIRDLHVLSEEGQQKKRYDTLTYYQPLAERIAPHIAAHFDVVQE